MRVLAGGAGNRLFSNRCLRPQPKQGARIFRQRISRGAEKATGNPLFVQKAGSRPLPAKTLTDSSGISRLCRYYETVERLVAARICRLIQIIKTYLTDKISTLERSLGHFFSGKQEIKLFLMKRVPRVSSYLPNSRAEGIRAQTRRLGGVLFVELNRAFWISDFGSDTPPTQWICTGPI